MFSLITPDFLENLSVLATLSNANISALELLEYTVLYSLS